MWTCPLTPVRGHFRACGEIRATSVGDRASFVVMTFASTLSLTNVQAPRRRTRGRFERMLRIDSTPRSDHDEVTGLLRRDVLFSQGTSLIEQARAESRDVAVVSVFVDDIDVPDCGYAEAERNVLLAAVATELSNVSNSADVVGRIGLAEMIIVTLIDSRGGAVRRMADSRRRVDTALSMVSTAFEARYDVGHAVSVGGMRDLGQLVDDSRIHRLACAA